MSKSILTLIAAAALALSAIAHAQTSPPPAQPPAAKPGAPPPQGGRTITEAQLRQELERLGFTKVSNIKQKGNMIEAKATKDGKRVTLNIDTSTGNVVAR
jgi:hypothetical protein